LHACRSTLEDPT